MQVIPVRLPYFLLFVCFLIGIAVYSYLKPYYNWDSITYIASAISLEQSDKKLVHDQAYEEVRKFVPAETFTGLVQGNYRQKMYSDVEAFSQQLPFFKLKILYVGLLCTLHKFGLNYFPATQIISIGSSLLLSCLALVWLIGYNDRNISYLLSIFLLSSAGIFEIARLSTPDAMSAAILFLSFLLLFRKRQPVIANILLLLSIFIRIENGAVALILMAYQRFFALTEYRIKNVLFVGFSAVAICSMISVQYAIGSFGWTTLFHHTFIEKLVSPAEFHGSVTVSEYGITLGKGIISGLVYNPPAIFFLFLGTLTLLCITDKCSQTMLFRHLSILMTVCIVCHVILFPDLSTRFFVAQYVVIGISLIATVESMLKRGQQPLQSMPVY